MADYIRFTEKICREIRVRVGAARGWAKSGRRLFCVCRPRAFNPGEMTPNALLWSSAVFNGPGRETSPLGTFRWSWLILKDVKREGMIGLELELYRSGRGTWPHTASQNSLDSCFVLLSTRGEILGTPSVTWTGLVTLADELVATECEKRLTRDKWADAVARWRKLACMPKSKVPLGIVADYAQDADDGQEDAVLIRAAIAANFKG